ncbi:DsrE family protein [Bacillus aquiflavi]|uniref:DsrE family protein n=1 Tax=Bacillus aquiflavi TaxID=2672567 RepID=A0A6B3VSE3_9BACI|nr:DsrE family protein [Bacillus aquiflavi]MBA4536522.1 DsrE family protein [Bacillus aquiflavi]NEY80889.1 DsrE family protein [Bacillus aquiflavi]UAC49611.1 DsrE family protein [Bacillus aquiflavi]
MSQPSFLITLTAKENNSNNVTIAFTMGVKALEKGHETAIMLLSDAVHLAKKGYADSIDIGAPFSPVKDLLTKFLEKGGQLKVCSSCMEHNGISKDDNLLENIEIITADDVIDYITNAKSTLQLNS